MRRPGRGLHQVWVCQCLCYPCRAGFPESVTDVREGALSLRLHGSFGDAAHFTRCNHFAQRQHSKKPSGLGRACGCYLLRSGALGFPDVKLDLGRDGAPAPTWLEARDRLQVRAIDFRRRRRVSICVGFSNQGPPSGR
jgi:hypothetical protein